MLVTGLGQQSHLAQQLQAPLLQVNSSHESRPIIAGRGQKPTARSVYKGTSQQQPKPSSQPDATQQPHQIQPHHNHRTMFPNRDQTILGTKYSVSEQPVQIPVSQRSSDVYHHTVRQPPHHPHNDINLMVITSKQPLPLKSTGPADAYESVFLGKFASNNNNGAADPIDDSKFKFVNQLLESQAVVKKTPQTSFLGSPQEPNSLRATSLARGSEVEPLTRHMQMMASGIVSQPQNALNLVKGRSAAAQSGEMQIFPNQGLQSLKSQAHQLQTHASKHSLDLEGNRSRLPPISSSLTQEAIPTFTISNYTPLQVPSFLPESQPYLASGQQRKTQRKQVQSLTGLLIDTHKQNQQRAPVPMQQSSQHNARVPAQDIVQQQDIKMLLKGQRMQVGLTHLDQQVVYQSSNLDKQLLRPPLMPPIHKQDSGTAAHQSPQRYVPLINPNQIFESHGSAPQNFHYIYDYLFVQVSSQVFDRDYSHRIKLVTAEATTPVPSDLLSCTSADLTIDRLARETQFPNLRLLREVDVLPFQSKPTEDETTHVALDEAVCLLLQDTTQQLNEMNKKFKVTFKKNYINDILSYAKGAQNVSHKVFLVVTDSQHINNQSAQKKVKRRRVIEEAASGGGGNSDAEQDPPGETEQSANKVRSKKTTPITKSKKAALVINQSRGGYESENEKSIDTQSTSTATLFPLSLKIRTANAEKAALAERTPKIKSGKSVMPTTTKAGRNSSLSENGDGFTTSQNKQTKVMVEPQVKHKVMAEPEVSKYGPTTIKLWHVWEPSPEIANHPIQKMFNAYNYLVRIVFIQKATYEDKYKQKLPQLLSCAKKLGLTLSKGQLQPANLKSRENSNLLKEQIVKCWCRIIAQTNVYSTETTQFFNKKLNEATRVQVEQEQANVAAMLQQCQEHDKQLPSYKVFVGKGNNAMLVRTLFKSRYWWLLHHEAEIDKVNFIWTQCRKAEIMKSIKCKLMTAKEQAAVERSPPVIKRKRNASSNPDQKPQAQADGQQTQRHTNNNAVDVSMMQYPVKIYNKLEDNYHLSNKKALFLNMRFYYEAIGQDPFHALPVTYHVKSGLDDPEFQRFTQFYQDASGEKSNIWIIKPGENTNQGIGISVSKDFNEISSLVEESTKSKKKTCIIQKYIANPLLINKRKFDIRTYACVTSINGNMKGYFYDEGYLRTSCREFTINNLSNKFVHLTNDAIQKKAEDYGKYESGNKLSYTDFQNYLDAKYTDKNVCFDRDLLPQIKKLTSDCMKAVWGKMDPLKRINTFEVFGLDFMFDDEFKPYLIEVNTNPCLELASPLLSRLIPNMLENAFRIVADPMYPPPEGFSQKKQVVHEICPECRFSLVFDEKVDGPALESAFKTKENVIVEIDEEEISDEEVPDEDNQ